MALFGTVLWIIETISIVVKLFCIHRTKNIEVENPTDLTNESQEQVKRYGEEQDTKLYEDEVEIHLENQRPDSEEQDTKLDEAEIHLENLRPDSEEQDTKLDEAEIHLENRRPDNKEHDTKFDEAEIHLENKRGSKEEKKQSDIEVGITLRIPNNVTISSDREGNEKKIRREKCVYRLGFLALILTGLFEDFPALLILFYTAVLPICGAPARQEITSGLASATVISSMLNCLWSMIPLFFELWECGKCCQICTHRKCLCSRSVRLNYCCLPPNQRCRKVFIIFGKLIFSLLILIVFLSSFILRLGIILFKETEFELVPQHPFNYPSRRYTPDQCSFYQCQTAGKHVPFFIRQHVVADGVGPGLDGKRDEAMFILIELKLPQEYQVVLFDDESVVTARSAWTNQIYNRLYIGQFEELRHLKDGTLTKAIPCSRVFSFVDKIDESFFIWPYSKPMRNTDISNCNLIFTLRFDSDRNN